MGRARTGLIAAAALLLCAFSPAPPESSPMRIAGKMSPPSGFVAFCKRVPAECATHTAGYGRSAGSDDDAATGAVERRRGYGRARHLRTETATPPSELRATLDTGRWTELQDVNRRINREIKPLTDSEAFGRYEYWTLPLSMDGVAVGDCEDYALEKRRELISRGWPESSLLLAAAMAPGYGRHAILVVVTDQGDYVLDNLNDDVKPWFSTGYTWQTRQDQRNPLRWVSVLNFRMTK